MEKVGQPKRAGKNRRIIVNSSAVTLGKRHKLFYDKRKRGLKASNFDLDARISLHKFAVQAHFGRASRSWLALFFHTEPRPYCFI